MKETTMQTTELTQSIELTDEERQPCEVWTRVMGYHRPAASFNLGKQGEHSERRFFREQDSG
jgi:anaerobic ribonucleoside-triphosphate reductase